MSESSSDEVNEVLREVLRDYLQEHGCLPSPLDLVNEAERRLADREHKPEQDQ